MNNLATTETCDKCGLVYYSRKGHECAEWTKGTVAQSQPAPDAEGEWLRDGSTVYELMNDGRGGRVNRWSAHVQGPRLTQEEAERIAAQIVRDHNAAAREGK